MSTEGTDQSRKSKVWSVEDRYKKLDEDYNAARYCSSKPATSRMLRAAMNEEPLAQAYVALLYYYGCAYVEKNLAEAQNYTRWSLEWIKSQLKKDNRYALFHYGCCLAEGREFMKNTADAIKAFTRAGRGSLDSADLQLALLYIKDPSPRRNRQGHAMLEQLAVDTSHPECLYHYAHAQRQGLHVPRDLPAAFMNFVRAARQGHREAMYCVGHCHLTGVGADANPAFAATWFKHAADLGAPLGQGAYAKCLKEGYGVPQNYAMAVEYYLKLAAHGDGAALHNLGLAHELGRGVKQDKEEAVEYYKQAMEAGHSLAWASKAAVYRLVHEK
jgi:TPR repeat protein